MSLLKCTTSWQAMSRASHMLLSSKALLRLYLGRWICLASQAPQGSSAQRALASTI